MSNICFNRKGQIGDTMTWTVATLIIIFILGVALYFSVPGGLINKKVDSTSIILRSDPIISHSLNAYLLTNEGRGIIYSGLVSEKSLNDATGNFAVKIFKGLYSEKYNEIWFGVYIPGKINVLNRNNLISPKNDYFGKLDLGKISFSLANVVGVSFSGTSDLEVYLDNQNRIKLYLERK